MEGLLIGLLVGVVLVQANVKPSLIVVVCCFTTYFIQFLFDEVKKRKESNNERDF